MADNHDHDQRPHGETGDTVQQAAEVSQPTSTVGRALDSDKVPQAPLSPDAANAPLANTAGRGNIPVPGNHDTSADAAPGQSHSW